MDLIYFIYLFQKEPYIWINIPANVSAPEFAEMLIFLTSLVYYVIVHKAFYWIALWTSVSGI